MTPWETGWARRGVRAMIIKWIGALCVVCASAGLGISCSNQWKEHLRTAEELRKMIFLLKGEILYAKSPLGEAFERVGKRCQGPLGTFFTEVAGRIEERNGEPFYTIWKNEVDKLGRDCELSGKDKQELSAFGEHLGYLDCDMQERTILLYLEQLDLTIDYLREHLREKSRLYTSLGIMGGLFLAIVMY